MPACKNPIFFSPSPTAHTPSGRGQGVGQKLQITKVHPSQLPGARLNSHRAFSFLDDVRQHLASP